MRTYRYYTWAAAMVQAHTLVDENGFRYRVFREPSRLWAVARAGRRPAPRS
jgi:hypothetical protein